MEACRVTKIPLSVMRSLRLCLPPGVSRGLGLRTSLRVRSARACMRGIVICGCLLRTVPPEVSAGRSETCRARVLSAFRIQATQLSHSQNHILAQALRRTDRVVVGIPYRRRRRGRGPSPYGASACPMLSAHDIVTRFGGEHMACAVHTPVMGFTILSCNGGGTR